MTKIDAGLQGDCQGAMHRVCGRTPHLYYLMLRGISQDVKVQ